LQESLQQRFTNVLWLGVLPRAELAKVYAAADVFVFPSRNETFGLVMLEAMACGTPVAAYPVDGPLQVLGPHPQGGVLDENLARAALQALACSREAAHARARTFGWQAVAQQFLANLVPVS
jgi:glycosyltransferase involved in cell wall biosynthesis